MKNDSPFITFIDSTLYKAAAKSQIDPFKSYSDPLDLLLTPTKNTILHINITQRTPSIPFLEHILTKCPSLLLKTNNKGETPLHMAARHGHDTIVQFLIQSSKDQHQDIETGAGAARAMLRMENISEETALHEAARHNHTNVVQVLIAEDPDFTYSANKAGETPLYLASERGYRRIVLRILDTCTSVSYHGPNGRTALHEAVIRNDSEMTRKILETKKSLVKEVDQQGWTPLHHASHFGHLSIVKQLLECDKSVAYISDKDAKIPLHLAAAGGGGKKYKEVVRSILQHCPDCHELVDRNGRNVLHFAVESKSCSFLNDIFKLMYNDYDGDYFPSLANLINEKDIDGNTPLHLAATYCIDSYLLIWHPLVDRMALNNNNSSALDLLLANSDQHSHGYKEYSSSSYISQTHSLTTPNP
ncbi:ankyrin repeat-containing protein At5g02620-like isoform X2 [Euphorbia lathyris]|uniref:ankyrin repeat-containing protein At5g02620-like isoform X2 n=1 Tax=Euphorbia lathyris TaxID=212925 RepID=UPI0033143839